MSSVQQEDPSCRTRRQEDKSSCSMWHRKQTCHPVQREDMSSHWALRNDLLLDQTTGLPVEPEDMSLVEQEEHVPYIYIYIYIYNVNHKLFVLLHVREFIWDGLLFNMLKYCKVMGWWRFTIVVYVWPYLLAEFDLCCLHQTIMCCLCSFSN